MGYINYTEAELRQFSPRMQPFYRNVLLSPFGREQLRKAGILDNARRWCHFMGQFGAETNGGELVRESLHYTTVKAVRAAWPARASKHTDAWITANLLRNPIALGDWAYGGRLGNAKGTPGNPHRDGYDYRGGGWLQTTGKANVAAYCAKCGLTLRADILDDAEATLQFACYEWQESGCNLLADENNLMGISKAINTGSATSSVYPNGMENRQKWFDRARAIWWDAEPVEDDAVESAPAHEIPVVEAVSAPVPKPREEPAEASADGGWLSWVSSRKFAQLNELAEEGSRLAAHLRKLKAWLWGLLTTIWTAATFVDPNAGNGSVVGNFIAKHPILAAAVLVTIIFAVFWAGVKLVEKYVLTAHKDGRYDPKKNDSGTGVLP